MKKIFNAFGINMKSALFILPIQIVFWSGIDVQAADIHVPADYKQIQKALDVAKEGDRVLVAPGTYHESLQFPKKPVTLASHFLITKDLAMVSKTILDGNVEGEKANSRTIIRIPKGVTGEVRISGFTIQNGDDGISCESSLRIDHNRFINNKDAIDYEGGGGFCRDNLFEKNLDDAIDLDGSCAVRIERNLIRDNHDDGIEIRLHPHSGAQLETFIAYNIISGNGEDGIQFIDYDAETSREFVIYRNIIQNTAMAGIGFMNNEVTKEDYRAARLDESIWVINNSFLSNEYGLTGGGNLKLENNLFVGHRKAALKGLTKKTQVFSNLLWENRVDWMDSSVDPKTFLNEDPLIDQKLKPHKNSPALKNGKIIDSVPFIDEGEKQSSFIGAIQDEDSLRIIDWDKKL